jgi:2-oxoglutarate dehydrogenase E2 component (dihydrolipoamide succinyltransferase)
MTMAAVAITVPSVGESITEGILARWLVASGSMVAQGDPLFELETDKATSIVPAPAAGLLKTGVAEGQTVAVGATVGTIDPEAAGGRAPVPGSLPARSASKGPGAATPGSLLTRSASEGSEAAEPGSLLTRSASEGPEAERARAPAAKSSGDMSMQAVERARRVQSPPAAEPAREDQVAAQTMPLSPAVRRLVAEEGVDVADVTATGPGGRITKGDVLGFLDSGQTAAPQPSGSLPGRGPDGASIESPRSAGPSTAIAAQVIPSEGGRRETRQRMSGLRQRIAERLVEAQRTAAILTTFNEADMSRVIELRSRYKEAFQSKHGVALGFMSFFVKAVIEALKAFPAVNARIEGNEIVYQHFYDIGVAVSTERGLIVPIVRDADRLSFAAIEQAIGQFAAKARDGKISVGDLQGGTFTITNGGVFGSLLSTPILNPPQSGILGMHAIKKRPIVVDDQVAVRPMMYLALSYDHRLVDGREAVGFLVRVKDCIESPERMMFGI